MYNVLIVDDEKLIREGLRTIVDWEAYGFRAADAAADAEEALRKLETSDADLIVADIRMPGMDGLQLMEKVTRRPGKHPRFLFLSGYADFDYARTAMRLKADGYMLKPVDEDELVEYLIKLKPILDKERAAAEAGKSAEPILLSLLTGSSRLPSESEWAAAGLLWPGYELILIRPHGDGKNGADTSARLKRKWAETLESDGAGTAFALESCIVLLLREDFRSVTGRHARIHAEIMEACREEGISFTAVTGGSTREIVEIEALYRRARELISARFWLGDDRIYDRVPAMEAQAAEGAESFRTDDFEERLFLSLDIGNAESAAALIRKAGRAMAAEGKPGEDIKAAFAAATGSVIGKLAQSRPELRGRSHAWSAEAFAIHGEPHYRGMMERLTRLAEEIAGSLRGSGNERHIRKMTDLIHRRYQENLKLETLAEALGYNSSYLGKLFKSVTGESFNTYLDKVRIGKAMELLEQGMKVYQVAERVGYSNVDYFHAKFRKYVGTSPTAYRKK
ncbi:response regulator [Cohnella caldifontis]|uniref:response regulator n=1 Tax=Cohnella caldifontis TaxID=3027471 RepID=UPI0023EDFD15|nr:response regulator [Cohnella sp. YIM B05605]